MAVLGRGRKKNEVAHRKERGLRERAYKIFRAGEGDWTLYPPVRGESKPGLISKEGGGGREQLKRREGMSR